MPPLTSFFMFLFSCVVCRLSYLWLFCRKRGVNHRGDNKFAVLPFLFCTAYGFLSVLFSLSSSFCFVSSHVLVFTFWSSDETCLFASLTVMVSASVCLLLFYLFLTMFCQYSSISLFSPFLSLHFYVFSTEMRGSVGSLLVIWLALSLSFFFLCLQVWFFLFRCSLPWSFQFFCAKIKRSLLSAVCCLHSESFSSGSLPHAARLTAWVKRTDLPRIANVLRGNRLNYAHCGGEDIHNSGIKLLKVMQYLALQLPAVYRRWGMFC